ncbi:LytR/AlgR family response regulator transcription factor [Anaerovorax odorimutans]|uniref:LytR/AlgR family response regulator transcription factor n=1 Tax=Anaerovorax odorimutans TaxID=109327 RepID=UPI000402870A|nr:LytTR family DNA-binding domain-containing protein [Anaerovorax odorimutans]
MLNILIIEDNSEEINYCCHIIKNILENCVILKAYNAEGALYLMNQHKIDIFFIDVELPGINGFQLAEKIRKNPQYILSYIVFVTGCSVNQIDIHRKYHHYDYIDKPYTLETFKNRIEPLLMELSFQKSKNFGRNIRKSTNAPIKDKMVLVETKEETCFIIFNDILYAETKGRRLTLHTKHTIFTDLKANMETFIKDVNSDAFLRCHKSYAVNVNNISIIKNMGRRLWHAYFSRNLNCYCPISETYYDEFRSQYLKIMEF